MPPEVSVIIPVYNRPDTLINAVNGVLKQTFKNLEIIVVDDGSDQAITSFQNLDQRIRVTRHSKNRGAGAARNTGVIEAKGKYLAFIDSDDEWLPHKLEIQIKWLDRYPEVKATTTGYILSSHEGDSAVIIKNQTNWYRYFMRGVAFSFGSTLMVEREVMLHHLYDEKLPRLEDWDWALRFSEKYGLFVIPQVLAKINKFSYPDAGSVEAANIAIIEKHRDSFKNEGYLYSQFCISKRYLEIATHYFREHNHKSGWKYFKKSILTFPIPRPGMVLRIFDYLLGTNIIIKIKNIWFKGLKNTRDRAKRDCGT